MFEFRLCAVVILPGRNIEIYAQVFQGPVEHRNIVGGIGRGGLYGHHIFIYPLDLIQVRCGVGRVPAGHHYFYNATTRSKEEWKGIWAPRTFLEKWGDPSFNMRGVNRYEKEEIIAEIDKMLADFCGRIETEGQTGYENRAASQN